MEHRCRVEPFHLFTYLDEQAFRYSERERRSISSSISLTTAFRRWLTHMELTGKDANTPI
jgi:hypothetical protein